MRGAARWLPAALAAFAFQAAAATPLPTVEAEAPVRMVRVHQEYQVAADGSFVEESEIVQRLQTSQAMHDGGQIRIPHSSSLDELKVVEAYTLKRNGRRVPVPASSVFVQDGLISPVGTTSFQDLKTTVIVFPDLEIGDSIALRSRLTRRRPTLPGIFTLAHAFPGDVLYDDVRITVQAPKAMPLRVDSTGLSASDPQDAGGYRRWTWTYRGERIERSEENAVDPLMYRPRLLVSSAASYEQMAAVIARNFAGKAQVTPAIRAKAAEITAGARSTAEKVERVQQWVARNVRYFAIVLDVGGYIPRPADEVLSSRFGDCKDHAVLLQALLSALGVASVPALLSTDPLYELPPVPVADAFNHVITYVPQLDAFLESNSPAVPPLVLPFPDVDKPVLLLGPVERRVERTPRLRSGDDLTRLETRIVVHADGSASGEDVLRARGPTAIEYAMWWDSLAGQDPLGVARQFLLRANLVGEGTVSSPGMGDDREFSMTLQYELTGFADLARVSSVRVLPPLDWFEANARGELLDARTRRSAYQCGSRTEQQTISVTFPRGVRLAMPQPLASAATASQRGYRSSYRAEGSTAIIERQYRSDLPRAWCPPADRAEVLKINQDVLADLRQLVQLVPAAR